MFAPVPFFGRGGDPPPLRVRLVHKRAAWDVVVDARATFGELRYEAKTLTGLPMDAFKLLFRGREKADGDPLLLAGIKDGAMVQVVETLAHQDQIRNAAAGMQRAQQAAPASPLQQPPRPQQPGVLHTLPNGAPAAAGPNPAQQTWNPTFPAASAAAGVGAAPQPQSAQQPRPQPGAAQQQGRPREDSSAGGRFDPPFPPPKRAAPPQQPAAAQPPQQQPQSAPQPGGQQQTQRRRGPIGPQPQPQPQQEAAADPAAALEAQLMGRIAAVQQELDGLTQQVDALTAEGGAPAAADPARHQRAVLLLELLTRVMLTLDGIRAPDGGETPSNVRAARKSGVVRAQQLVDRVEDCKAA